MANTRPFYKLISKFFGGITRDDKSTILGTALNVEELDIWTNGNYFQAEQIVSADSMPATTSIYARTAGSDDVAYGVGKETATNKLRIVSVASGSATNPGSFATLFTSADATNLPSPEIDVKFFKTTEAANNTYLLYVKGTGSTWYLYKYNIGTATETQVGQLTGLGSTFRRPTIKVIFGDAYICNGVYISKFAKDTTFSEKAFTLPTEWEAVDIEAVGDAAIILCRNIVRAQNETRGYWWSLTSTAQFEDMFSIPVGGPCWIKNLKESVTIFCAINGTGRFFRLSAAAKGAIPIEIPGIQVMNVATETSTAPISAPKMLSTKDKILYFGLNKTDKTGIYAIGQIDNDKPIAFILSKRYSTTDYSLHIAYSLCIQGPNFYGDFSNNGTDSSVRCATNNSPTRSSNAIYESIWMDMDEPFKAKSLDKVIVQSYPLVASTAVVVSLATDYSASYTVFKRADGTDHNTTSAIQGKVRGSLGSYRKVIRAKIQLTSSGSSSPKVVAIGFYGVIQEETESV